MESAIRRWISVPLHALRCQANRRGVAPESSFASDGREAGMQLDNSDLALSLLSIVRTAIWLVLIAELLADRQPKHIGDRRGVPASRCW